MSPSNFCARNIWFYRHTATLTVTLMSPYCLDVSSCWTLCSFWFLLQLSGFSCHSRPQLSCRLRQDVIETAGCKRAAAVAHLERHNWLDSIICGNICSQYGSTLETSNLHLPKLVDNRDKVRICRCGQVEW